MAKPDNAGAGSTDYMHLFGLVALGYMWARWPKAAQAKIAAGDGAAARMTAKLVTGRFFMERMLPETAAHLARIQAGADTHDGAAGGGVLTGCHGSAQQRQARRRHDQDHHRGADHGRDMAPAERRDGGHRGAEPERADGDQEAQVEAFYQPAP